MPVFLGTTTIIAYFALRWGLSSRSNELASTKVQSAAECCSPCTAHINGFTWRKTVLTSNIMGSLTGKNFRQKQCLHSDSPPGNYLLSLRGYPSHLSSEKYKLGWI